MPMSRTERGCVPRYARWLRSTNNITQQFLAIGGRQDFVSLAGGLPAAELYPIEAGREAIDPAFKRGETHALQNGPVPGVSAMSGTIPPPLTPVARPGLTPR